MFAVKPRIEIVFRILMATAILLSAPLNVISARADDVTVTPTQVPSETPTTEPTSTPTDRVVQITETPTPATETSFPVTGTSTLATATPPPATETPTSLTGTATPSVTVTPIPATAEARMVRAILPTITLSSNPDFITPGGIFNLNWSIEGTSPDGLVLQFIIPQGISPHGNEAGTYNESNHTLSLNLTSLRGRVQFEASNTVSGVTMQADLLEGDAALASASLYLPAHEQFVLGKQGGEIDAMGGRVRLNVPPDTLAEETVIDIGEPSGESAVQSSLSGHAFEIRAHHVNSGEEVKHFGKKLSIFVSYEGLEISEERAEDLYLYWYNPETGEWEALPSKSNTNTKTVHAFTDHFTVFDISVNNWQANHLPTVDSFQVAKFTGAATYSLPIEAPPGPGAFQPSLSLSYNSQVVDQATLLTQASWVGMGWSLETGSIELDTHGTSTWTGDDTHLLNVGGVSTRIVKDPSGVYHAADENFWKISYIPYNSADPSGTNIWIVKDKEGNTYKFTHKSYYPYGWCDTGALQYITYRWSLTEVTNKFNQTISYTYADQLQTIEVWTTTGGQCAAQYPYAIAATYPSSITYAGGRYRVRFDTGSQQNRWDYPVGWDNFVFKPYEKYRLEHIFIEQDANGDQNFDVIRKYQLSYKSNNEDIIFPGYTATSGGQTLTLASVQQYGVGGSGTPLPATTFYYNDPGSDLDGLHLLRAENGYGGAVEFDYEFWHYPDRGRESQSVEISFGGANAPCSTSSASPWFARPGSLVNCNGYPGPMNVRGVATTDDIRTSVYYSDRLDLVRPGGIYKLTANITTGGTVFTDVSATHWAKTQIEGLNYLGILNGCNTDPMKFCPGNTVPRANVAVELLRLKYGASYSPPWPASQRFSDVPSGHWGYSWIDKFAADGYTAGCGGGKFCPNDNVKRIDMVIFLLRSKYGSAYTPPPVTVHYFSDMSGNALEAWANKAYTDGIVNNSILAGCGSGKFCPNAFITRDWEAAVIENTHHLVGNPVPSIRGGINNGTGDSLRSLTFNSNYITLPPTASKAEPLIEVANSPTPGLVSSFKFELLTSIYRVKEKWIYDGNHSQAFSKTTYSYLDGSGDTARVNDRTLSPDSTCDPGSTTCFAYAETLSEFRGHSEVTETQIDPATNAVLGKTITVFNQDDLRKGRPISVTIQDGNSVNLSQVGFGYASTPLSIASYRPCSGCIAYIGLRRDFLYTDYETRTTYDKTGTAVAVTRTDYTYESTYGNLTEQADQSCFGTSCSTYRKTEYTYIYKDTPETYLAHLPAKIKVYDGSPTPSPLSITINLYDGNLAEYYDTTKLLSKGGIGKLTSIRTWMHGSNDYSQVTYGYDDWGNRNSETTYDSYGTWNTAPPSGPRTTTTIFDPDFHTYPISRTTPPTQYAPAGLTTYWNYDYDRNGIDDYMLGLPTLETSPNGARTKAEYDPFGRLIQLFRPDPATGTEEATASLTITYSGSFPFTTTLTQKIDDMRSYVVTRVYDGLGRQTSITSGNSIVDTIYYSATETRQSEPYFSGETRYFIKTINDPVERMIKITAPKVLSDPYGADNTPDTIDSLTSISGLSTTVTDAKNNVTTTTNDVWGRTVNIAPPTGPAVTYTYDEMDRLKSATRGGVTTSLFYDNAGRKTQMIDPDMGTWYYTYDALSNLKTQTDARGCTLTLGYDSLNRLTGKLSSGSCGTHISSTYTYDYGTNGKGQRTGMADASGSSSWTYDQRGRMLTETKTISGLGTYNTSWAYNAADLPVSMTYPGDGETVAFDYNNQMLLEKLRDTKNTPANLSDDYLYVSSTAYDSASRITSRILGNQVAQNYKYFDWNTQGGRLEKMAAGTGTWDNASFDFENNLQKLTYTYDPVGNITQITNNSTGVDEKQIYKYDKLDRLRCWGLTDRNGTSQCDTYNLSTDQLGTVPLPAGDTEYSYDAASGNQNKKGNLSYSYNAQVTCSAGTRTIPHAVSAASPYTFTYDCNGNQTSQAGNGQTLNYGYDAENRMISVSGSVTASFVYDGDGKRVQATVNGITTTFVGSYYELTGSTVTKYYMAGTQRVAMRKYTVPQSMTLEYLLTDHLGSTSITTDSGGAKVSEIRYKPWGEIRFSWTSGMVTTPAYKLSSHTFTGQYSYMDDPTTTGVTEGFGLMFYNARFYSPYINHFIQPDTIIPDQTNSQSWNRYSYVNNNPLRYTDPTGHMLDDGCNSGQCGGSAVGTANMFVKIAKNKPQYRKQALKIIARTYNISLASGDKWDYAESIVSGGGATLGWTPSQANDPYKDAKGTRHLANDSSVYLTGDLFSTCETASCIGGIMAHEATHSWVESSIEAQGLERSSTDITASSAEEALADSIGMQLGDPEGLLMAHWNRSLQNYKDPRTPFAYLQDFYKIDLSNLLSQIFSR